MEWARMEEAYDPADGDVGWERTAALVRAGNRIGATYTIRDETGQGFHAAAAMVAHLARVLDFAAAQPGGSGSEQPAATAPLGPGPADPARSNG